MSDVQMVEGSTRNKIQAAIDSATNGISGGTGASALTNANNFFTIASTNTFNGQIQASNIVINGISNNRGLVVTNDVCGSAYTVIFPHPTGSTIIMNSSNNVRSIQLDVNAADSEVNLEGYKALKGIGTALTLASPSFATLNIGTDTSLATTWNGTTIAIPNGLNIGSGQLNIPSSGTVTNSSSLTVINTLACSNFTSTVGRTLSVTNLGISGATNVEVFASGILTNKFTL